MPRKSKPNSSPGPQPTPITAVLVENLAARGCTLEEIAAAVGLSRRHFIRRLKEEKLTDAFERGKAKGRVTLRGWQWAAAEAGNVVAQIWLGKQLLGQRSFEKEEKPEPVKAGNVTYQWVPRKQEASTAPSSTVPLPAKPDSTTPPADSKDSPDQ